MNEHVILLRIALDSLRLARGDSPTRLRLAIIALICSCAAKERKLREAAKHDL